MLLAPASLRVPVSSPYRQQDTRLMLSHAYEHSSRGSTLQSTMLSCASDPVAEKSSAVQQVFSCLGWWHRENKSAVLYVTMIAADSCMDDDPPWYHIQLLLPLC